MCMHDYRMVLRDWAVSNMPTEKCKICPSMIAHCLIAVLRHQNGVQKDGAHRQL